ncbi:hypothetical protein KM043_004060 [Ampulex compressa]|nr:hypothetical protein KM043_004060 [Ampulex compressa]
MEEKLRGREENLSGAAVSFGKPNEVATAKIIELSKKCRERTAEVEVLKSKCKNLEANLANTKANLEKERREIKRLSSDTPIDSTESSQTSSKGDEDRVKFLTEKLQQTQAKLYESKNMCASLKQEVNKAQKLLCSEVGESISVAVLSSQPGGWRGRAEQIRLLQQKITELQSRLSDYEGSAKRSCVSFERKNLQNLRDAEKERRRQLENFAKELRQAEVSLEAHRRKLDASKARIKVLENELTVTKGSVAALNEKRCHDECLIEALNHRLKAADAKYQERETELRNREEQIERECTNLKNDLQAAQIQTDRLRRKLEEREIEIDKLRNPPMPDTESIRNQRIIRSEIPANNLPYNNTPNSCRSIGEPNEYVTLALAAEGERQRLLELVSILNRRLDKERSDADILSDSLRNERSKSAKLESRLRKLETERVGIVKIDSGYKSKFLPKSLRTNDEFITLEQARLKMELLEEECLALKARLDSVQQDKAADLTMYKRMLEQARRTFQDACRNKVQITRGTRSTITV